MRGLKKYSMLRYLSLQVKKKVKRDMEDKNNGKTPSGNKMQIFMIFLLIAVSVALVYFA